MPQSLHLFSSDVWRLSSKYRFPFSYFVPLPFLASDLWLKVSSLRYSSCLLPGSKTLKQRGKVSRHTDQSAVSVNLTSTESSDWPIFVNQTTSTFLCLSRRFVSSRAAQSVAHGLNSATHNVWLAHQMFIAYKKWRKKVYNFNCCSYGLHFLWGDGVFKYVDPSLLVIVFL